MPEVDKARHANVALRYALFFSPCQYGLSDLRLYAFIKSYVKRIAASRSAIWRMRRCSMGPLRYWQQPCRATRLASDMPPSSARILCPFKRARILGILPIASEVNVVSCSQSRHLKGFAQPLVHEKHVIQDGDGKGFVCILF